MSRHLWKTVRRPLLLLTLAALACVTISPAFGQILRSRRVVYAPPVIVQPAAPQPEPQQQPVAHEETTNEAAPISPKVSPGPMSLEACLGLGMQHQPALDAARASLDAAYSGSRSLNRLIIPRLFMKDLPIRRQQASHGITIAEAGLTQAEWETRYSITRNFFTVQYVRLQQRVVDDVLRTLTDGLTKARKIADAGDPNFKITKNDVDAIEVQLALVEAKKSTIDNGMLKAIAALREAMGLRHDYPLEIAEADLPPAVYVYSSQKVLNDKGKPTGNVIEKYRPLYNPERDSLIAAAVAGRGEMIQAAEAQRITQLEVAAQGRIRGWQGKTFAAGADLHARPIPQGIFNNEYRPGAIGLEMPSLLAGRIADRVQRACDLSRRADAVVDKTINLVSLDVDAQYLKWREAATEVSELKAVVEKARRLPANVQKLQPKDLTSGAIVQSNMMSIMVRTQLNDAMHMHALALAGLERATAGAFRVYPVPPIPSAVKK